MRRLDRRASFNGAARWPGGPVRPERTSFAMESRGYLSVVDWRIADPEPICCSGKTKGLALCKPLSLLVEQTRFEPANPSHPDPSCQSTPERELLKHRPFRSAVVRWFPRPSALSVEKSVVEPARSDGGMIGSCESKSGQRSRASRDFLDRRPPRVLTSRSTVTEDGPVRVCFSVSP
jgi:hypothetical protein